MFTLRKLHSLPSSLSQLTLRFSFWYLCLLILLPLEIMHLLEWFLQTVPLHPRNMSHQIKLYKRSHCRKYVIIHFYWNDEAIVFTMLNWSKCYQKWQLFIKLSRNVTKGKNNIFSLAYHESDLNPDGCQDIKCLWIKSQYLCLDQAINMLLIFLLLFCRLCSGGHFSCLSFRDVTVFFCQWISPTRLKMCGRVFCPCTVFSALKNVSSRLNQCSW